jgi:hypothetical protein
MLILNKHLKNFATVLLIVILTVIDLGLPAWAQMQSERYPTDAELQKAIEKFRLDIPTFQRSSQFTTGPRIPALEFFITAWLPVDPAVAPFIGTWAGQEYDWSIYPSNIRGRVCVLFNHPMRGGTGNNAYFSLGSVSNGQLRSKGESFTGESYRVFIREKNYLGSVSVQSNTTEIQPFVRRIPLIPPTNLPITNLQEKARLIQQFNAAGCTTSLPNQ